MNSQAEVRSHLLTNPRMAKSDSMPNTRTFVIVGGGLAGVTAPAQSPAELADADVWFLGELACQLRADSIRCSTSAASGHPTSAVSAADLMAVLLARHLRYDWTSRPIQATTA